MGAETEYLAPPAADSDRAAAMMHPTVCSFIKCALEAILEGGFEGVLLTSCCDSSRRLFDVLKSKYPQKFIYMVELPVKTGSESQAVYLSSLKRMINAYAGFSGVSFSAGALLAETRSGARPEAGNYSPADGALNVGLAGARFGADLIETLRRCGANVAFNLSCTGHTHSFEALAGDGGELMSRAEDGGEALLGAYAEGLFSQYPCMRMLARGLREEVLAALAGGVSGIIYHTVKFCDNYACEYASLAEDPGLPVLKLETDYAARGEGQLLTRVKAFLETLGAGDGPESQASFAGGLSAASGCFMGIDSGSTSTNAVIIDSGGRMLSWSVVRTGSRTAESAARARDEALERAGMSAASLRNIIATGYGRTSIPFAGGAVTEISCHGLGAHHLNPLTRTILDIGGQDSKAIRIEGNGSVVDFAMNDKCAAGTGRFLEMMARTLEMELDDMGDESLAWKEDLRVSSMCAVFAESEVISLIASGKERADILHALHMAIASRSEALLARADGRAPYAMTGGVARNKGVVRALEERLGADFHVCEQPEIAGALGAALIAGGLCP